MRTSFPVMRTVFPAVSADLRVSRIYRHLAASPSFGGQIAGAGGTRRLSYLSTAILKHR